MLDANLKSQLKTYLERITQPVELVASLDDRPASAEMHALLDDIVALSDKVHLRLDGQDARRPSFAIRRIGTEMGVSFAAIPMGHEFTSLVLALLQAGGHPPKVPADVIAQIQALDVDLVFETYMSLTCHNCPDVVQALNLMAVLNPRVRHVAIDGGLFKDEVEQRQIMAVPTVFLNGQHFGSGRMELAEILARVDTAPRSATPPRWAPRRRSTCW
jgi:alkyl hydroperoxide reductase subunit F